MSWWEKLEKRFRREEFGLIEVGKFVRSKAIENITIQRAIRTGNLKNSITYKLDLKGDFKKVFIGTNVEYAPYVEFGTVKMKAKPYLRPALMNNINEIRTIFKEVLRRCLQ